MFVKLFGNCSQPLTIMLNQGNLPIRQRLPQLESLVLQLVAPHGSSDEVRQYLDKLGHDDAIITSYYMPFVLRFLHVLLEWMTIYLFWAWVFVSIPVSPEILQKL